MKDHRAEGPGENAVGALEAMPGFRDLFSRLGNSADGFLPPAAFVVGNALFGLVWAMVAASVAALGAIAYRWRRGERASPLLWVMVAFIAARGALGISTGSHIAFFAPQVATGFLIAAVFFGSLAVRKPVIGAMTNALYPLPETVRSDAGVQRTFMGLTAMWSIYIVIATVFQLWLLSTATPSGFVVVRMLFNWATTPFLVLITLHYWRRVIRHGRRILAAAAVGAP